MKRIVSTNWVREIIETPNVKISTQRTTRVTKSGMKVGFSTRIRLKDVFEDLGHEYSDFEFNEYIVDSIKFEDGSVWESDVVTHYGPDIENTQISEITLIDESSNQKIRITYNATKGIAPKKWLDITMTHIDLVAGFVIHTKTITCTEYSGAPINYTIDDMYYNPTSIDYNNSIIRYLVLDKKCTMIPKKIIESKENIVVARGIIVTLNANKLEGNIITSTLNLYQEKATPVSITSHKIKNVDDRTLCEKETEYETLTFKVSQDEYNNDGQVNTRRYIGTMYSKTQQLLGNETVYKTYYETDFTGISDDKMKLCVRKYRRDDGTVLHRIYKDSPVNNKGIITMDLVYDENEDLISSTQTSYGDDDTIFRVTKSHTTTHEISPTISAKEEIKYLRFKDEDLREVDREVHVIYTLPLENFGQITKVIFRKKK